MSSKQLLEYYLCLSVAAELCFASFSEVPRAH